MSGQANADIEITPSMIKAGVKHLCTKLGTERWVGDDSLIVAEVFSAMIEECRGHELKSHIARCPSCDRGFSAVELATMAQGDGITRWILVQGTNGKAVPVRFGEFNPQTMKPFAVGQSHCEDG